MEESINKSLLKIMEYDDYISTPVKNQKEAYSLVSKMRIKLRDFIKKNPDHDDELEELRISLKKISSYLL